MDRPADQPQDAAPGQPRPGNPLARISAITGNARPVPDTTNGTTPPAVASATPALPSEAAAAPTPGGQPASAPPAFGVPQLGRLARADATRLWSSDEAFSRWVADNLDALTDVVDLRLAKPEVLGGEIPVVLAGAGDGTSAVVLAQRGPSTDDAFGALVRHFAASAAAHAVWVSGDPTSEHVAAVSWLNRAVDGRFVMVRVDAVTIGDSAAAPTFELAVRTPRADDAGVHSALPEADAEPHGERRADDWLGSLRAEVTEVPD